MTFRQLLAVLWFRRLIIAGTTLLVLVCTVFFLHRETPAFESTAAVRLQQAASQAYATSGAYGAAGIPFDSDPSQALINKKAMSSAAKEAGDASPSALTANVTSAYVSGQFHDIVTFTAIGATPEQAQRRAGAVAKAYVDELTQQVSDGRAYLVGEKQIQGDLVIKIQNQLDQLPAGKSDPVRESQAQTAATQAAVYASDIAKLDTAKIPGNVQPPVPLGASTHSPKALVYAVALIAGLLAGVGIALIRDQFDDRMRSEREVEGLTGVPSLGYLPEEKRSKRDPVLIPAARRSQTPFTEGIRALRTSLQVLLPDRGAVVLLTSPEPGDGKSFVTANLAVSFARAGKSVIVLSGDLRRSAVDALFGPGSGGAGFADLLRTASATGSVPDADELATLLLDTEFPGLRLLPAGAAPSDPADLLATSGVREVISSLATLADIVIIDSPPALALADAAILSAHADGVVLIASLNRTDRNELTETVSALTARGATMLGVVGNRSRRKLPKSYGAYSWASPRRPTVVPEDVEPAAEAVVETAATTPDVGEVTVAETPPDPPRRPRPIDPATGEPVRRPRPIDPATGQPVRRPRPIDPATGQPVRRPRPIDPATGQPVRRPRPIDPATGQPVRRPRPATEGSTTRTRRPRPSGSATGEPRPRRTASGSRPANGETTAAASEHTGSTTGSNGVAKPLNGHPVELPEV